ncbi:MAG TPA: hypothetical protein VD907_06725 [Verrucomicrobiae bacterium]|nr:hypothetical protein [Verrucomicrobiae bacterium]
MSKKHVIMGVEGKTGFGVRDPYTTLKLKYDRMRTELEKIEAYCARFESNTVARVVAAAANKALQQSQEG